MPKLTIPQEELMNKGNLGCQGCTASLVMRYLLKALGKRTIITIPACCWTVIASYYPSTTMKIPFVHVAFETTAASASGIVAGLEAKGIKDVNVVGFAGDGGTVDIGIQALSGAVERNHNFIYVCYDNEAYMNTGIQRSGATPYGTWTATTPEGKFEKKKNIDEIMIAHGIPYLATACTSYPEDFIKKVEKAKVIRGAKFLHVLAPCPTGWGYSPEKSIEIGKVAVESNIFPLYEVENGKYTVRKFARKRTVKEYLRMQGRFSGIKDEEIEKIQRDVDKEWNLLLKKEEWTKEF